MLVKVDLYTTKDQHFRDKSRNITMSLSIYTKLTILEGYKASLSYEELNPCMGGKSIKQTTSTLLPITGRPDSP